MAYSVSFRNHAIKSLEKINEPFYTKIKKAIYSLAEDPRPKGFKKLKGREALEFELPITVLFTKFLKMIY